MTEVIRNASKRLRDRALNTYDYWASRGVAAAPIAAVTAGRPLSSRALLLNPSAIFSPDRSFIESYSRIDEAQKAQFDSRGRDQVHHGNIPFSKYLGEWQFHPGRIGGHLITAPISRRLTSTAVAARDRMIELPNGGLALYYPDTIQTARLQANEPIYSGIAQGLLLAGFTRLGSEGAPRPKGIDWWEIAARIATSMKFPFEQGGVCMEGKIILEVPTFRSCPEIILNGWIDALLHLYDYIELAGASEWHEFYRCNLSATVDLLPMFDVPSQCLSRYSNLTPYVFRVGLAPGQTIPPIKARVEYLANKTDYSDYYIPELWGVEGLKNAAYDNKLLNHDANRLDLKLSVSGLHDIRLIIGANCRSITFDPGRAGTHASMPKPSLKRCAIAPAIPFDGHATTFFISSSKYGLIPGTPTNFKKGNSENFYHSYHVAALYELALTTEDKMQRDVLVQYASKWLDYESAPVHRRRRCGFIRPDHYVQRISRLRARPSATTLEELQKLAAT